MHEVESWLAGAVGAATTSLVATFSAVVAGDGWGIIAVAFSGASAALVMVWRAIRVMHHATEAADDAWRSTVERLSLELAAAHREIARLKHPGNDTKGTP